MSSLAPWEKRPVEEAHLFNPSFCGALAYELVKSHTKAAAKSGTELPLVFCALPICLHMETRQKLPSSTATSMYTWLQRHPETLVGYAARARDLAPYIKQSLAFGLARSTLIIDESGAVLLGKRRAAFTPKFLETATSEVRDIIMSTRMLGRWFAGAGTAATVLAAWGITV